VIVHATLATVIAIAVAGQPQAPRYANVAVEAAVEGEAGSVLERRIRERAAVVLRASAVLPARGAGDPTITVNVQPVAGEAPGYAYRLEVERAGESIAAPVDGRCDLCTEGELVASIEVDLGAVVAGLPRIAPSPRALPPPRATHDDARVDDRRIGSKGIAGAVLLSAGAAALATGIGLAVAAPRPDPEDPRFDLTTRPVGYALLGAGAATAIVGAVLLAVDLRQRRHASLRTAMRF
jgi:hypothetical protein